MTVLHIVPAIPFGGMQRIAALLAAQQRQSGLDVRVIAIYSGEELRDLLERKKVPHVFLDGTRPGLRMMRQLFSMASENWSIIHLHGGLRWSNLVELAARRSPVVYHAHNYPDSSPSLKSRVLHRLNRALADVVIAVSQDVARAWRETVPGLEVTCVYNAVEFPTGTKPARAIQSPSSPMFGMATRLVKDKGIFEFVDVAEAICARRKEAQFILAGDGPDRDSLIAEVNRRGLGLSFRFPGYIRDLNAFWSDVDVALFTAQCEPFGLRILEAIVRGIPVAAYLTGAGSDELVCPASAPVTAAWNDAAGLAEKALTLCDNPSFYAEIAESAFRDAQDRFSIPAMAEGVMSVYQGVARA